MKIASLLGSITAAMLASAALADVTINFDGPQNLVGSTEFFVTSPQLSGTITGVIFHYNFANPNDTLSYSSDMACVVGVEQWGYYNHLLTDVTVNHLQIPGATQTLDDQIFTSGTLALTTPIVCSNTTVRVGYGNGYNGGGCIMSEVSVTLVGVVPGSGPFPPSVGGGTSTSSGPVASDRLLTVVVTPGGNPASAVTSVSGNLSSIGGPSSAAFHNDGLNGDVSSADNIYSFALASATGGGVVTVTATDALARTSSGNITVTAPPVDAGVIAGGPGGADNVITVPVDITSVGQIRWIKFNTIADVLGTDAKYLDIDSEGTTGLTDTELGVYRTDGSLVASDDDDGSGNFTALSFGNTASPRPAVGGGVAGNGRDGDLIAGTYYVAAAAYNVEFGAGFAVTSTGTALGTIPVNFRTNLPNNTTDPTNPHVGLVSVTRATPGLVASGDTVLVTSSIIPGTNPASTALAVTANLTSIGGGSAVVMRDNGIAPDAAVDGIYTASAVATGSGTQTITVNAIDGQSRAGTRNGTVSFVTDVGAITGNPDGSEKITTTVVAVTPAQARWIKFHTNNDVTNDGATYVDIDTEGTGEDATVTGSLNDTMMGIYREDGTRVDNPVNALLGYDDDSGSYQRSQLTFGATAAPRPAFVPASGSTDDQSLPYDGSNGDLPTGTYYVAAETYGGAWVWGATNFGVVSAGTVTGDITVNFRSNLPGGCSQVDIGVTGGAPGHDNRLDNNDFIVFINIFFAQAPAADLGVTGGTPGHDGLWDNNDFIVFINIFFNDTPNCTG